MGVGHPQRLEDLFVGEHIERLAGDFLHHELEDDHVPVAIDHVRARRVLERPRVDLVEVLLSAARGAEDVRARLETAAVGEDLLDRYLRLLRRIELREV